jgi:hypothetical protein
MKRKQYLREIRFRECIAEVPKMYSRGGVSDVQMRSVGR